MAVTRGSQAAGKRGMTRTDEQDREAMIEFQKIWIEQCDAARGIRDAFGLEKALGYLIGEKFLNFLQVAAQDPLWAGEVPAFVAEIKEIFEPEEIRAYMNRVHRVGALGHVASDEVYGMMREAGAVDESPVRWAEQILRLERAKKLLLG